MTKIKKPTKKVSKKDSKIVSKKKQAFDIRTHILVPKHRKMKEKEVESLLKKYNIKKQNLPKINKIDVALQDIDAVPGDVIEIIRKSPTAGEVKYYRVVVSE